MVDNIKQKTVVHFIADGEVKEFNFNFQIFEAGDVDVYLDEVLTDTGYNISIDDNIGGKVIFSQPPSNGTRITIIRNLDIKRTSDFQEGGAFRAKVINHELDYQVATLEQLDEKISRSMIYPPYAQDGISTSLPLPSAGKALVWNQQATALTNSSINVDNTIAEVTALQEKAQDYAEQSQNNAKMVSSYLEETENILNQNKQLLTQAEAFAQDAEDEADRAAQYVEKASFGNIGDIKYTTRTDIPNGGAWCDGAEYSKEMFPDIYQMLVDGKLQKTDYSTFSSSVSTKGSCGFFALDTTTQKFKVPKLADVYLKAGQAPSMFSAESLPNITGSYTAGQLLDCNKEGTYATGTGAISISSPTSLSGCTAWGGGTGVKSWYFDASRSSSAYQNGAKVNPEHVVYRAYVVLYSSVAEVSIADYTSLLEEKTQEGLDALSSASNALTQNDITNCITKIPQDIKLELSNGTLTLKAGSQPRDGKGNIIYITKDYVVDSSGSSGVVGVYYSKGQDKLYANQPMSLATSGETPPSGTGMFYNTVTKSVDFYNNGNLSESDWSFPLAVVTTLNGQVTSIDQVFNGFGYIGSTVFALPGVEGLIPNGRNADGSLNNTKFMITNIITETKGNFTQDQIQLINGANLSGYRDGDVYYDENKNQNINFVGSVVTYCVFGIANLKSGRVTSFSPKLCFQAIDRNDTEWASTAGKPSSRYVDLSLQASGAQYTAPANGWIQLIKTPTGEGQYLVANSLDIPNTGTDTNNIAFKWSIYNGLNDGIFFPVRKGQQFTIGYTFGGATVSFKFIYDEGSK